MAQNSRLALAKTAAKDVIDALTIGDHFGVVEFNTYASTLNSGGRLLQATVENKNAMKARVDGLSDGGSTNFYGAFEEAFDLIDASTAYEYTSNCHTAILFLTDGEMTTGGTASQVYNLINQRNAAHDATVFTYSLGSGADDVVPKAIACETGGIWAGIPDGDDLSSYMTGYYKLLAMGLGDGANEGFTAWVEPYAFSTGGGMGTTVSAPVYDRSASPPMFIGVAGIDFTVDFMQEVAGDSYEAVLGALVTQSTARCPDFTINECELQALRKLSGGTEAMCAGECTATTEIEPTACLSSSDYPSRFWANLDEQGKSYTDRVCCDKGSGPPAAPSGKCTDKKKGGLSTGGAIAIGVCMAILVISIPLGVGYYQHRKSTAPQNQAPAARAPPPLPMAVAEPIIVPPPPPGHVSGARAAAMAQGEVIAPSAPPAPTRSWFGSAEPEPEQWAPEAEK